MMFLLTRHALPFSHFRGVAGECPNRPTPSSTNAVLRSLQAQGAGELMEMAQKFCYVNGNLNPPTSIEFDKKLLRDLFYNQSAAKVDCPNLDFWNNVCMECRLSGAEVVY